MKEPLGLRNYSSVSSTSRPHLHSLTSLRFFAAFLVFILHSSNHDLISSSSFNIFDLSKAVSFFFVLSGFVLTYAYTSRSINTSTFYLSRFLRIWPVTIFSLLLVIIFLPANLYLPFEVSVFSPGLIFIANLFCIQSFIPIPTFFFGFNAVCWSISVELFFYFCFPYLQRLRLFNLMYICLFNVLLVSAISLLLTPLDLPLFGLDSLDLVVIEGISYVNPFFRLPEFLLGIISCKLFLQLSLSNPLDNLPSISSRPHLFSFIELISFFLLILFALTPLSTSLPPAPAILLNQLKSGICFSLVLIIVSNSRGLLCKILQFPFFIFLGNISFSFYLVHQIIIIRSAQAGGFSIGGTQLLPANFRYVLIVSVVLSSFIYYFLEKPIKKIYMNKSRC